MTERPTGPTGEDQNQDKKSNKFIRARDTLLFGALGLSSGTLSYLTTRIVGGSENLAENIGEGVGGSLAAGGTGIMWSHVSLDEAEDYADQGNILKSRLKLLQAVIEGAGGVGAIGGIAGYKAGGLTWGAIGTGIGGTLAAISTVENYRERRQPIPEPHLPNNSMRRDTTFPDRKEGTKFPPVYRADSLKDLREFREAYKQILLKKGHMSFPEKSDTMPHQLSMSRLANAVIIIPDLQHYPAFDPEKSKDMKLSGTSDNIIVHPLEHDSSSFWPNQTFFEFVVGLSRYFDKEQWEYWKGKSWKQEVVILAQLQTSTRVKLGNKPENITDNYWLLDILGDDDGSSRRPVREKDPEGRTRPAINPQQI